MYCYFGCATYLWLTSGAGFEHVHNIATNINPSTMPRISCTLVYQQQGSPELQESPTIVGIQIPANMLANRAGVSSVVTGTLLAALQQHASRHPIPPVFLPIIHRTFNIPSGIAVSTIRVPDFKVIKSPQNGYRFLGHIESISFGWNCPSHVFDPAQEILAIGPGRANPHTVSFAEIWEPSSVNLSNHFIVIFSADFDAQPSLCLPPRSSPTPTTALHPSDSVSRQNSPHDGMSVISQAHSNTASEHTVSTAASFGSVDPTLLLTAGSGNLNTPFFDLDFGSPAPNQNAYDSGEVHGGHRTTASGDTDNGFEHTSRSRNESSSQRAGLPHLSPDMTIADVLDAFEISGALREAATIPANHNLHIVESIIRFNALTDILGRLGLKIAGVAVAKRRVTFTSCNLTVKLEDVLRVFNWNTTTFDNKKSWMLWAKRAASASWNEEGS